MTELVEQEVVEPKKKVKSKFISENKEVVVQPVQAQKQLPAEIANGVLESVKNKFDIVVVVGLKDGVIDVATSAPQYPTVQWMLKRAEFELLIAEKANLGQPV